MKGRFTSAIYAPQCANTVGAYGLGRELNPVCPAFVLTSWRCHGLEINQNMALPKLEPIRDEDLPAFCAFLHANLNPAIAADVWADAFRQDWGVNKPNNGFLIRDDAGAIVGGIGAIYAAYPVHGKVEQFCNITSWMVLDAYRTQSMRLAMTLISQPGFHYTDLSPTAVVEQSLKFLKFTPMNEARTLLFNLPAPHQRLTGAGIASNPAHIEQVLDAASAKVYRDHKHFPWLKFVAVGKGNERSLVIYKRATLKSLPSADIIGFTNPEVFLRFLPVLGCHFLLAGMVTTRVETRLLPARPVWPHTELKGYRHRVFRSDSLGEADIQNLYSEYVALDL